MTLRTQAMHGLEILRKVEGKTMSKILTAILGTLLLGGAIQASLKHMSIGEPKTNIQMKSVVKNIPSKIVQISSKGDYASVWVLCEDGTVWLINHHNGYKNLVAHSGGAK